MLTKAQEWLEKNDFLVVIVIALGRLSPFVQVPDSHLLQGHIKGQVTIVHPVGCIKKEP